jgi:hypothetical protein
MDKINRIQGLTFFETIFDTVMTLLPKDDSPFGNYEY